MLSLCLLKPVLLVFRGGLLKNQVALECLFILVDHSSRVKRGISNVKIIQPGMQMGEGKLQGETNKKEKTLAQHFPFAYFLRFAFTLAANLHISYTFHGWD